MRLCRRGLSWAAFVLVALAINVVSATTAFAQTMTVGQPELVYSNYDPGTTSDLSRATLRKNATEFYSWTSNGQFAFAKYSGPPGNPNATTHWSGYAGRWDFNGFPAGYRPWLGNVYKHTDGTLIGFVHIETDRWDLPTCEYRQGIAISTDMGDHWKYVGDVIKSSLEAPGQQNLGGFPVIVVGPYFYAYFNEYRTGFFRHPAVARALVTDVVAAAKNHTVSPWKKYYEGTWTEDALTGKASSVLPYPSDRHDEHGDATYVAPLGKYLLTVYEQEGYDYVTFQKSDARKGIYMYSSTDGINWGDKRHVYTPPPGGDGCYPFFVGLDGASDDGMVMGSSFSLYVHDRAPAPAGQKLYRIPITITGGDATVGDAGLVDAGAATEDAGTVASRPGDSANGPGAGSNAGGAPAGTTGEGESGDGQSRDASSASACSHSGGGPTNGLPSAVVLGFGFLGFLRRRKRK